MRETEEEAGLKETRDYEILDRSFKIETNYLVNGTDPKTVVYWVAKVNQPDVNVTLSHEHIAFKWLDLDKTLEIVGFEKTKDVFLKAHEFIKKR